MCEVLLPVLMKKKHIADAVLGAAVDFVFVPNEIANSSTIKLIYSKENSKW